VLAKEFDYNIFYFNFRKSYEKMYKKNYHPLAIFLYASGMLDVKQDGELPETTKYNWNQFKHENYYETDWVSSYINQFDNIKDVFASAFPYKSLRFLIETRKGYLNMLQEFSHSKQLLKLHANKIITSIENMKSLANVNVKTACKYYGISKDWYYREKAKIVCSISPFEKCYRRSN
jgi:hypothetical protein